MGRVEVDSDSRLAYVVVYVFCTSNLTSGMLRSIYILAYVNNTHIHIHTVGIYGEYSLICRNSFSKNMVQVWWINWIFIGTCTLYWYWEIVVD